MSSETGDRDQQCMSVSILHSAWGMLGLIMPVSLVLLWPSWVSLSEIWLHWPDYSHGYLVAIICLGLIFRQRTFLQTRRCEPFIWGLVPLIIFEFVWLIARLAYLEIVELLLLPLIVWTVCLTVMGWGSSRKLQFPFFFLYFAIPIWHSGNHILQQITVVVVEYMINFAGFPAYIQENFVYLAAGTFEIADGCSGLHYLIAAITIAALYGYLHFEKLRDRIILLLVFSLAALIGNWLRVFLVIYAGYATNMQHYLVTVDHYYFGWILFALIMLPVFVITRLSQSGLKSNSNLTMDAVIPNDDPSGGRAASVILLTLVTAFMAVISLLSTVNMGTPENVDVYIEAPAGNAKWMITESVGHDWRPFFVGPKQEILKDYINEGNVVTLYMNLYTDQSQGKELVGFNNEIEGENDWNIDRSSISTLQLADSVKWNFRNLTLKSIDNEHRVIYYWYEVNGYRTVADLNVKILQGVSRLSGDSAAGIVAISAKCMMNDCERAQLHLKSWLNEIWQEQARTRSTE